MASAGSMSFSYLPLLGYFGGTSNALTLGSNHGSTQPSDWEEIQDGAAIGH